MKALRKALVVGASGFFGNEIARQLHQSGSEVWGAYSSRADSVPDFCHKLQISEIATLDDDFDTVFVAAGNHSLSPSELVATNVTITQMVSKAHPKAKLVYISSVSVYGRHDDLITEESSFNQPTTYGLAKLGGELIARTHDRHAIIRPTYLYGPNMPQNSFLPFIISAAKSKHITLYGDGSRLQDYLHVQDAASLCLSAALSDTNGTYLAATGTSTSNADIARKLQQLIPGCTLDYAREDTAPWFRFNPEVTMHSLSWRPTAKLEDFLETTVA